MQINVCAVAAIILYRSDMKFRRRLLPLRIISHIEEKYRQASSWLYCTLWPDFDSDRNTHTHFVVDVSLPFLCITRGASKNGNISGYFVVEFECTWVKWPQDRGVEINLLQLSITFLFLQCSRPLILSFFLSIAEEESTWKAAKRVQP